MKKEQFGKVTIYQGDCMELMAGIDDKAFDLAIVDPPYGIGVTKMNMGGRKTVRPSLKRWDEEVPDDKYFYRFSGSQKIRLYGAVIISTCLRASILPYGLKGRLCMVETLPSANLHGFGAEEPEYISKAQTISVASTPPKNP